MMRITFFIILLITILFTRCSFRGFFAKKYIIETVDEYCDFVDVDTSFIIKVIDYAPANEMKTIATASNCLGITITNDTEYGLGNYIQTEDKEKAKRVAKKLRSGLVYINGNGLDPGTPYGGYRQSGNGREGGVWGLEEYLEVKTITGWK